MIKCREAKSFQVQFIKELTKDLINHKHKNVNIEDIFSIMKDMLWYLHDEESDKYETNQGFLGM